MDLYRFFDKGGDLLYVGISLSAAHRASQHRSTQSWWPEVASMDVRHLDTDVRREAEAIERQVIIDEHPKYNVAHNARREVQITGLNDMRPFIWLCEICDQPIDDGAGHIELPVGEERRWDRELAEHRDRFPMKAKVPLQPLDWKELFDRPESPHWWAVHLACDPTPEGGGYWFDVARARWPRQLVSWTVHLMAKSWFFMPDEPGPRTDWDDLLQSSTMSNTVRTRRRVPIKAAS